MYHHFHTYMVSVDREGAKTISRTYHVLVLSLALLFITVWLFGDNTPTTPQPCPDSKFLVWHAVPLTNNDTETLSSQWHATAVCVTHPHPVHPFCSELLHRVFKPLLHLECNALDENQSS